ncbi:MAG TPA: hypothetical protein ENJ00_00910 [Phycisphaerales bacterium]|nr:hypothetical protein [Phycisphaerales bacterium]
MVEYNFDPEGNLVSTKRGDDSPQQVVYAEAEHTELAPAQPWGYDRPSGTKIIRVDTYIPGRPDLFEPSEMLPILSELTQQLAEAERSYVDEYKNTPKGQRELEKSQRRSSQIFGIHLDRAALILTGLVLIGIGGYTWWRQR